MSNKQNDHYEETKREAEEEKGIDYSKDNVYDAIGRPDLKPKTSYEITIKKGLFEDKVKAEFELNCFEVANHFEFFGNATSETGYKSLFVLKEEMAGKTAEQFLKENLEADFGNGNVEVKKIK